MILIIPIYNGEAYVQDTCRCLDEWVTENAGILSRVVFVNDGSSDNTGNLCKDYATHSLVPVTILCHKKNMGKGAALSFAFRWCVAHGLDEWCAFTDVELPYGLDMLLENTGGSVSVIGVRCGATSISPVRAMSSVFFHWLLPMKIQHISDTQCGIKMCSPEVVQRIIEKTVTRKWVFDVEFLLCAVSVGQVRQVIVPYRNGFVQGRGGVRLWKHAPRILLDMMRIYYRLMLGLYTPNR